MLEVTGQANPGCRNFCGWRSSRRPASAPASRARRRGPLSFVTVLLAASLFVLGTSTTFEVARMRLLALAVGG